MKPSDQDRLLREILEDSADGDARTASLTAGLSYLQSRRRRERFAQVALAATASLLVAALCSFFTVPPPHGARPVASTVHLPVADAGIKVISDEELFALFPKRAMALIGPRGQQQLVFLDHGAATEQP